MESTVEKTTIQLNTKERKLIIHLLGVYCNKEDFDIPHGTETALAREMYDTFKRD